MKTTQETILKEIMSDTGYSEDRIQALYIDATKEEENLLNDFLICLCGWSWDTIQKMRSEQ